ncbi:MAG: sugar phosphate nucleotidyltransferase, partial [bacterium]
MDQVIAKLHKSRVIFAIQEKQNGTADAVKCAQMPFTNFEGELFVLCGDMPLVRGETLQKMLDFHREKGSSATVMTGILEDPAQYGRIVRSDDGEFAEIIEYADGDDKIRAIKEVNSGTYVFDASELWPALDQISSDNAQGEFYLTDVMTVLKNKGKTVAAWKVEDSSELLGVNTPEQLRMAETALKTR